jgi:hypothetical protein
MVAGDLVSYGLHPREMVEFIRTHATLAVRGNHDEALAHGVPCRCVPASGPLADATQAEHRKALAPGDLGYLGWCRSSER